MANIAFLCDVNIHCRNAVYFVKLFLSYKYIHKLFTPWFYDFAERVTADQKVTFAHVTTTSP